MQEENAHAEPSRKLATFLGFRLHRGEPDLPTKLRAYTGSLLTKDGTSRIARNNYSDHQLARWYGVSFKLRWFAGLWVFGETSYPAENGPIPGERK